MQFSLTNIICRYSAFGSILQFRLQLWWLQYFYTRSEISLCVAWDIRQSTALSPFIDAARRRSTIPQYYDSYQRSKLSHTAGRAGILNAAKGPDKIIVATAESAARHWETRAHYTQQTAMRDTADTLHWTTANRISKGIVPIVDTKHLSAHFVHWLHALHHTVGLCWQWS